MFLLGYNLRHKLAKAVAWSCIKVRWSRGHKVKNTEKLRRTSVAAMPHQLKRKRGKKYKAALRKRERFVRYPR